MKKIFIAVLIFRLVISFLPAMSIDMGCWQAWAMRMVEVGPAHFYSTQVFTDNPPGYLYIFWVVGWIKEGLGTLGVLGTLGKDGFEWLLKLPGNLFDLGTGLLIYKIISYKRGGLSWPKLGFLFYTLNPAVWFNTSVFGQFDGAGAFFGLLAVYLILDSGNRKASRNLIFAGVAFAVAWAVKPQAIALAPAIGILLIFCHPERSEGSHGTSIFRAALGFIGTTLLLYWPFFPTNPLEGIFYVFSRMNNIYSCTTCFAFNFWGIFGNWGNDQVLFLGVPLMWWGIGMAGLGMLGVLGKLGKLGEAKVYLAIAVSIMAFFMFVTRMHERYLFPFFAFFLISAVLSKSRFLMLYYLFISGLSLLNVYYPYANYNPQYGLTPGLVIWLGEHFRALSMIGFGSFLVLLWWYWRGLFAGPVACSSRPTCSPAAALARRDPLRARHPLIESRIKDPSWSKREVIIVFLLVFVSFLIRVIRLDTPPTYYFDEVYHAFTAEAYARNDPRGYEWWNTPPAGFAYEWLHPPLAKLIQAGSIKILGDHPFSWRFPGTVFAAMTVGLLYLFGRSLFRSQRAGFIAAFLYCFDGLSFAQSRITMNDIYIAFFILLSFYLFWEYWQGRKKLVWTGVALGLACSTKWTGFYAIPILGFLYGISLISQRRLRGKEITRVFLIFIAIPIVIYFLSYSQFWLQGHTWAQFQELHNQIWYYQTHLKATHPYQSGALSWPLMQRPVWYYVNYGLNDQTVANIYGLGNPAIWWGGIVAIVWIIVILIRRVTKVANGKWRNLLAPRDSLALIFILIGYFGFFLPWALSPRIMFLYHYLPSLPFLCLALGYGLNKIWQIGLIGQIWGIKITGKLLTIFYLILATLTFVYFYPQLSAWPVAKEWADQYFWFSGWR